MRLRAALGLMVALLAAGCGARHGPPRSGPATATGTSAAHTGLRVGVVGPLSVAVTGVVAQYGTLAQVAEAPFVLVSGAAAPLATVANTARAHRASHFAFVGASTKNDRARNLVGLVPSDDQAAMLAGLVAGYAAAGNGGTSPRVAWVGPEEHRLARAFAQGVRRALPRAVVLDVWSSSIPSRCKEAALAAIGRGATVVAAHAGLCAEAAIAGAHDQDIPGLQLGDFEFPDVIANLAARDAAAGLFYGGEDVVFGMASGAVGIGTVDPRISFATIVLARAAAQ